MDNIFKKSIILGTIGLTSLVINAYSNQNNKLLEKEEEIMDNYRNIIEQSEESGLYTAENENGKKDIMDPEINRDIRGIEDTLNNEKSKYDGIKSKEDSNEDNYNIWNEPLNIKPKNNSIYNGKRDRIGDKELDNFFGN
ncbi:MAG: hypothetical protein ACQER9_03795 [Nanobdellota archaeon]